MTFMAAIWIEEKAQILVDIYGRLQNATHGLETLQRAVERALYIVASFLRT